MVLENVKVINETGIHARPASDFVHLANSFKSNITITNIKTNENANAKSIMSVLCLALVKGTEIEIKVEGEDEKEALSALVALVNSGFGE
ncbi:MAG: HPr family phosphocarrier protein [Firmicutes bacterium]|nr:HPr family phosphocarrier protein [Bacillota bacterium]